MLCACTMSMCSDAIRASSWRALRLSLSGLAVAFTSGMNSPPKAWSSAASGPSSAATSARVPACSSPAATMSAVRATGSSRSAGTICRMVAPAKVWGDACVSSCSVLTQPMSSTGAGRRSRCGALASVTVCGEIRCHPALNTICPQLGLLPSSRQISLRSPMNDPCLKFLSVGTGPAARRITVRVRQGAAPGLFWLGGFKSDMRGTKAEALDQWARDHGRAMTRFDYSGHGESGGNFTDGTIGRWLEESLAVFDACCRGAQIVIGSSMGGWLALLLARELARRAPAAPSIASLVLVAPAVDFTEELMWKRFPPEVKREIEEHGVWARPSQYSNEPYPITRGLIEDGRAHLLLDDMIETGCPVRILQGVQDPDVPWQHAVELTSRFARDDVVLTLVKDGDHRLSRPEDIERLIAAVAEF